MNKKLVLLAVPHLVVGAIAIWAAHKAHEVDEYAATSAGYNDLHDAIINLEKNVQQLDRKLKDIDEKAQSAGWRADSAIGRVEEVKADLEKVKKDLLLLQLDRRR